MPGSRVGTWGSQFGNNNFANQGESSKKDSWVSDEYEWYFITWDKLKEWLERNFPNPPEPYTEKVRETHVSNRMPELT